MALLLNCTVGNDFNRACGRQIAHAISCLVGCGGAVNLIAEVCVVPAVQCQT